MKQNLFQVWIEWLRDLGGSYEPVRDLSEPKPFTGRRDPNNKPRTYPLDSKKYGVAKNGSIRRLF